MDAVHALREHLLRTLSWHDAHVPFDAAVKDVPPATRGLQPPGLPYSLWQLLEHIRIAQSDILDFCRNPSYRAPDWPADYWPVTPAPPTAAAWDESVAAVRADRVAMERLVADPGVDLYATIPHGEGRTYLREVLLVVDHNAFHVGQFVAIRRMLGAWES